MWCKSDWFPSKALIPPHWQSIFYTLLATTDSPFRSPWKPCDPPKILQAPSLSTPPPTPQPFSFSVQSCELVVADSRENVWAFDSCLLNWINGDIFCVLLLQPKNAHKLMAPPPNHLIYTGNGARKKTYLVVTWTAFSISWKKNEILRPYVYYQFFQKNRSSFCEHTHTRREVWLAVMHLDFQVTIAFGWLPLRLSVTPTDQSPSPLGKTIQLHVAPGFNLYTELRSPASFCPWWFLGESK